MMIGHAIVGQGNTRVLALHGWLGDWTVFAPMLPALDLDRFCFAFMDYRGFGRSVDIEGEYSLTEIAGDALSLADHLGWEQFSLLGHSMGGAAALRVTIDAPRRVRKIVAATPVPASGVPLEAGARALFESAAQNLDARQAIIDFTTGGRLSHAWSRELASRSWSSSKPKAFATYFDAWSNAAFTDEARGIAIPMLVLIGEHDAGITESAMRVTYLADYPDCQLKILTNTGHYPMQEIPVTFATEVQTFLDPVY